MERGETRVVLGLQVRKASSYKLSLFFGVILLSSLIIRPIVDMVAFDVLAKDGTSQSQESAETDETTADEDSTTEIVQPEIAKYYKADQNPVTVTIPNDSDVQYLLVGIFDSDDKAVEEFYIPTSECTSDDAGENVVCQVKDAVEKSIGDDSYYEWGGLLEGEYYAEFKAYDAKDKVIDELAGKIDNFAVDETAPHVDSLIIDNALDGSVRGTLETSVQVADNFKVKNVVVQVKLPDVNGMCSTESKLVAEGDQSVISEDGSYKVLIELGDDVATGDYCLAATATDMVDHTDESLAQMFSYQAVIVPVEPDKEPIADVIPIDKTIPLKPVIEIAIDKPGADGTDIFMPVSSGESDLFNNASVLGMSQENKFVDSPLGGDNGNLFDNGSSSVVAVTSSPSGWKLLGVVWYWWLILASIAILAVWLVIAGLHKEAQAQ